MDEDQNNDYSYDVIDLANYQYKKKKVNNRRDEMDLVSIPSSRMSLRKKNQEKLKSPTVSRATATTLIKKTGVDTFPITNQDTRVTYTEPYCHVKLNSITNLKESTKKLLRLLEDIQTKTRTLNLYNVESIPKIKSEADSEPATTELIDSVTDDCASALQRLETQTQILQNIPTEDEDDDCSIFKRLTRKCNCLNQQEYNDIVILFNENTKYETNTSGELIKNLRILKKFLYMGGAYTKHALMFLNEGFEYCSYNEKVEITQGCVHADMCNVFEDISLVISCIAWPLKYDTYGDSVTQELAAALLHKFSQFEEGRRYLQYTSKLSSDIKKVLRKKSDGLTYKTIEYLQATLDALNPKDTENDKITKSLPADEGYGCKIVYELKNYRKYMTSNEINAYLNLIYNYSCKTNGLKELTNIMNRVVELFQEMLIGYNDSKMNIVITKILNNIVSNTLRIKKENEKSPKILTIANVGTEPIQMKNECQQLTHPIMYRTRPELFEKNPHRIKGYMKDIYHKKERKKCSVIIIPKEKSKRRHK